MADTLREIDEAVQRHIAQAFPGQITDAWVLVTHSAGLSSDEQGLHNYRVIEPAHQSWHVAAGLIRAAANVSQDAWDYDSADEDD